MAMQTSRLGLIKPEYNEYVEVGVLNENFDKLDEAYGELSKRATPPDFDNLLMWPGCVRATPPKNGDTWVERIVTKADKQLRAERITVRVGEGDYTETYRFYYEDGVTLKESYIVHTTQDEDGTWYEDITREGGDEPPEDTDGGSSGGTPDDDVATDEEFDAMLDDIFGEKSPEDAPSEDVPTEDTDDVATDEEFDAMLDEIFGAE